MKTLVAFRKPLVPGFIPSYTLVLTVTEVIFFKPSLLSKCGGQGELITLARRLSPKVAENVNLNI